MVHGIRETSNKVRMNSSNPIQIRRCPQILFIPTSEDMDYPFTAHGFTSGNNGRLGVPEWKLVKYAEFSEGAEIWEVFNDGTEKLRAIFDGVKFNRVR